MHTDYQNKARSASRRLQNSVKSNRNDPQCWRVAPPASFTLRKRRQHSIIAGALENRFRSLLGKHTTEMILWSMISVSAAEWLSFPFIGHGKSDKTFHWQTNICWRTISSLSLSLKITHRHGLGSGRSLMFIIHLLGKRSSIHPLENSTNKKGEK